MAEVLLALAGTLAILLVHTSLTDAGCFLYFVRDVLAALAGREALAALVFVLLAGLYRRFARAPYSWRRLERLKLFLLAAFFAATSTLGAVYRADDGVLSGFGTPFHLLLMAGKMIGFFSLFFIGMKAILLSLPAIAQKAALQEGVERGAVRRCFLLTALCLACAWAPWFLAHFPGTVTADGGRVLQQYFGEITPTADHPVAYTFLAGFLVRLGALLGGSLAGILCYTLVQWLLLLAAMAWSVSELRREGFPPLFRYAVTAVYALHPAIAQTGTAIVKDIPYVTAFVAYMLVTVSVSPSAGMLAFPGLVGGLRGFSLLILLLRHNGVLAVVPMTAVLAVRFTARTRAGTGPVWAAGGPGGRICCSTAWWSLPSPSRLKRPRTCWGWPSSKPRESSGTNRTA